MEWPSERFQNLPYFWNMKSKSNVVVFSFFILCNFIFSLMKAMIYVPEHSLGEKNVSQNEKIENLHRFSFHMPKKYGKFWSVLLSHFITHAKPLIYEEGSPKTVDFFKTRL